MILNVDGDFWFKTFEWCSFWLKSNKNSRAQSKTGNLFVNLHIFDGFLFFLSLSRIRNIYSFTVCCKQQLKAHSLGFLDTESVWHSRNGSISYMQTSKLSERMQAFSLSNECSLKTRSIFSTWFQLIHAVASIQIYPVQLSVLSLVHWALFDCVRTMRQVWMSLHVEIGFGNSVHSRLFDQLRLEFILKMRSEWNIRIVLRNSHRFRLSTKQYC